MRGEFNSAGRWHRHFRGAGCFASPLAMVVSADECCDRLIGAACDRVLRHCAGLVLLTMHANKITDHAVRQKGHTRPNTAIAPFGFAWRNSSRNRADDRRRPRPDGAGFCSNWPQQVRLPRSIAIQRRSVFAASRGLLIDVENRGGRRAESMLAGQRRHCAQAESYFQSLDSVDSPTDRTSSRPAAIADVALFKASES